MEKSSRVLAILVATAMVIGSVAGVAFFFVSADRVQQWKIHPDLLAAMEATQGDQTRVTAAVHIAWNPDFTGIMYEMEPVKAMLKAEAESTQAPIIDWLAQRDAVVINSFWLTNMILLSATEQVVYQLTSLPEVDWIADNFEITVEDPVEGQQVYPGWQLDNVNVKPVWEELGITGDGVRVATTDTGLEIGHPDLQGRLWTDNPADPTYPGGWIEYDCGGNIVQGSTPHDTMGHGTATASLVLGDAASGVPIGMAPDAVLMHALTLPGGGGCFAQVVAGLEWVIDPVDQFGDPAGEPARVSSHSWGAAGYWQELVEPIRNMWFAGHVVVASIGNTGPGFSGSPGNVYETVAAGATDINDDVPFFSSGEEVCKSDWPDPPPDWPDCYIVPDLGAPGLDVYVAFPPDTYIYWSGTSFSSPLIGGMFTLMVAANPGLAPDEYLQTAIDGADWWPKYAEAPPDDRLGWGRINAFNAVLPIAFKQGITGSVTDAQTGEPLEFATVSIPALDRSVQTKVDGSFEIRIPAGIYDVEVSRFGYITEIITGVVVPEEVFVTLDVALTPAPRGTIEGTIQYDPTGIGVPGVLVDVLGVPIPISAETGWEGAYGLELPEGTYDLQSRLTGFSCTGVTGIVVVADQVTTGVDMTCAKLPSAAIIGDFNGQLAGLLTDAGLQAVDTDWSVVTNAGLYDLIIVGTLAGDPGSATFDALIEATDEAGTGVMFLDNWGGFFSGSGIYLRSNYLGVPTFRSDHYQLFTPTWYETTAEHPIFGDRPPGSVIIREPGAAVFNDHAWFWDFSGVLEVLAWTAHTTFYNDGQGIAVEERATNRHVLMSMSGPTVFQNVPMWTPEHNEILVNATLWAAREPKPFAVWDTLVDGRWELKTTPDVGLWSEDTSVPVGVKNLGADTGTKTVSLLVESQTWDSQTVTLASGQSVTLSFAIQHWTVDQDGDIFVIHDVNPPGQITDYSVSAEHLTGAFTIRPPAVTVSAFTVDYPVDPVPLQDATVLVLWKDDGKNPYATGEWQLIFEGLIGADGSLTFPSPRSREDYTIVVKHDNYGYVSINSYLFTEPAFVEGDAGFTFAPTTDNSAVVDLGFDQLDPNHEAIVWLLSPDMCPEPPAGCLLLPYSPGSLVATPNVYISGVVFTWQTLDDLWVYPTDFSVQVWYPPGSYELSFGGNLVLNLADVREQQAPDISIDWSLEDGYGQQVSAIVQIPAMEFPSAVLGLDNWFSLFAQMPTLHKPKLTLINPFGKILATDSIEWEERPKSIGFWPKGAGVHDLMLRVETGPWSGLMDAESILIVPARTVTNWIRGEGDTFDVTVTFDAPLAGDTAVGLEEIVPAGFNLVSWEASREPTDQADFQWVWAVGDYDPGEIITVTYTVEVGAGVPLGDYTIQGNVLTGTGDSRAIAGMSTVRIIQIPEGAVLGTVFEISGDMFSGAKVSLWSAGGKVAETMTDDYGFFMLQAPEGQYTLTVEKTGYESYSEDITIQRGMATDTIIADDKVVDGTVVWAPMPLKPTLHYVLRILDRWVAGELRTETTAHLLDNWKS